MNTFLTILSVAAIFGLPYPIVLLTRKNKLLGIVGAIACCYICGLAFSAIGFCGYSYDKGLTGDMAYVLVALSIPLILFSIDLRCVRKLAKSTVIGFILSIVSVAVVSVAAYFICRKFLPSAADLSAMIVGLYTGGTPNLNAIGAGMNAGENVISAANLSDTVVGGIYFLTLISFMPKLYRAVLGKKEKINSAPAAKSGPTAEEKTASVKPADDYCFGFTLKDKKCVLKLLGALGLAVVCIGAGAAIEFIAEGTVASNLLYILLSVSVLGVAFSFIRPVREIKGSYTLGMYLILSFSIALSMSIDWSIFLADIMPTLAFFACAQLSVIALHMLLCKLFRIDGDTAIITSTASVYGPPFIAPVAKAAGAADLIAPGVICGAVGLAIGTLLGLGIGNLLLLF